MFIPQDDNRSARIIAKTAAHAGFQYATDRIQDAGAAEAGYRRGPWEKGIVAMAILFIIISAFVYGDIIHDATMPLREMHFKCVPATWDKEFCDTFFPYHI